MKNLKKITLLCVALLLVLTSICMATDNISVTEGTGQITDEPANSIEDTAPITIMNSDLYLGSKEAVVVEQPVDGNVFVLADTVTLKGEINGDAFILAKTLKVEDTAVIYNSLYVLATTVSMNGAARDVYACTTEFAFGEEAYIDRDLKLASNKLALNGFINRDVYMSVEEVTIPENAETIIYGDLHYSSAQEITLPEGVVAGEVHYTAITVQEPTIGEKIASYATSFLSVILYMSLVIVLAVFLAPKFISKACYVTKKHSFAAAGIGVLAFVLIPVLAFILMITGVLTFVGFALAVAYGLILSITLAILSLAVGKLITLKLKNPTKGKLILFSILAAVVIWLLQKIPYVGGYVSLFTLVFGLGIFVYTLFSKKGIEEEQQ